MYNFENTAIFSQTKSLLSHRWRIATFPWLLSRRSGGGRGWRHWQIQRARPFVLLQTICWIYHSAPFYVCSAPTDSPPMYYLKKYDSLNLNLELTWLEVRFWNWPFKVRRYVFRTVSTSWIRWCHFYVRISIIEKKLLMKNHRREKR